ncbi:alpha/beta hydrolase family protein [Liberiplasma polymorphum]|uniref:alpha/beta hydrolase family protein n=1 Tax=Liberiplasma polymorphum TaxID=3374570 RepID=UPI0037723862
MKKIGIILTSIVLLFVVVSGVLTKITYDQSFPRYNRHDETINAFIRYSDIEEDYERTLVNFDSNGNSLQGYIYPNSEALGLVVIAHGIGGGADSYLAYTKWFLDNGWAVFSYDATGSFDSEGKTTKGFPQSLIDLESALNYIETNESINDLELVLFGHSWGGYAVANILHLNDNIKAVVTAAAPSNADDMILEQATKMLGFFAITQKPFLAMYQRLLFGEYAKYDAIDAINQSNAHVFIIHGEQDEMVSYTGSAIIARNSLITNPNVITMVSTIDGKNGHNNLFRSNEAIEYINEINSEYRALYDEYNQNIPYEVNQTFYEGIDRFKVQALNETLMQLIHDFYVNALNS